MFTDDLNHNECNYSSALEDLDSIGFNKLSVILFPIFSILALIINSGFVFMFVKKVKTQKKQKFRPLKNDFESSPWWKAWSLFFGFLILCIFSTFLRIKTNCFECKITGAIGIFWYLFDWLLLTATIYQYKNIIWNPISSVLKPDKKLVLYTFLCAGPALLGALLSYFWKMSGVSPMITCFLFANFTNIQPEKGFDLLLSQTFVFFIVMLVPICNVVLAAYQGVIIIKSKTWINDKELRTEFFKYCFYICEYMIFAFLLFCLYVYDYIFDFDHDKSKDIVGYKILRWTSFSVSIITCWSPLLIALSRVGHIIYKYFNKYIENRKRKDNYLIESNWWQSIRTDPFLNIELKAIQKFMLNIFVTACYTLQESKNSPNITRGEITSNNCQESNCLNITQQQVIENKNSPWADDSHVLNGGHFSISCIEFAPKIFSYLRKLDGIKEDDWILSLLPMNNRKGINESEGRSGNFFINTDDKEFILKTINYDDLEWIRGWWLEKMTNHFTENPSSIIGRIYGLYKIKMKTGLFTEDELTFILMKNVFGAFNENLWVKYDLKGSSYNRRTKTDEEISKAVLKDVNFAEFEGGWLLSVGNSNRLVETAIKDARFLESLGIMDYSLLVVKISLNLDEIKSLFGKFHRLDSEKQIEEIIGEDKEKDEPVQRDLVLEESNPEYIAIGEEIISDAFNLNNKGGSLGDNLAENNIRFNIKHIGNLRKYLFPSLKADVAYIISIIDFFQWYDLKKNFETKLKQFKTNYHSISSIPPNDYWKRFINNLNNISDAKNLLSKKNVDDYVVVDRQDIEKEERSSIDKIKQ